MQKTDLYSIHCAGCGEEIKPGEHIVIVEDCGSYHRHRWQRNRMTAMCGKITCCSDRTASSAMWNGREVTST